MKKKATLLNKQLEAQRAEFNKYYPKARELVEKILNEYHGGIQEWDYLSDNQRLLQTLYVIDLEKLNGVEVRLTLNDDGDEVDGATLSDMGWSSDQGVIASVGNHGWYYFDVNFPDYSRYSTHIGATEAITDLIPLFPDLKAWIKDYPLMKINRLVAILDTNKNATRTNLENNLMGYQSDMDHYQKNIINLGKSILADTEKLANLVVDPYTLDRLKADINKLNKHSGVESAYISEEGIICVVTKMLYNHNPLDGKKGRLKIGRFYIEMYPSLGTINIYNLDYRYYHPDGLTNYWHPCIKGKVVCWGEHKYQVEEMLSTAKFFVLTDFIITFLSTYPHSLDSNPWIGFDRWREKRVKTTSEEATSNNWYTIKESYQW